MALNGGSPEIIRIVTERLPAMPQWTTSTQRALHAALLAENKDQVRLLLGKHATPPTPEGKSVPLLAYAITMNDAPLFSALLSCGADPNTVLPTRCDKDFLALLQAKSLRSYVEEDKNFTVLMLAAGLGQENYLRALLDAGANRNRGSSRNKMSPLDIEPAPQAVPSFQIGALPGSRRPDSAPKKGLHSFRPELFPRIRQRHMRWRRHSRWFPHRRWQRYHRRRPRFRWPSPNRSSTRRWNTSG